MNWTKEEKDTLEQVVVTTGWQANMVLAVADKATELLAARGGTMTANEIGKGRRAAMEYGGMSEPDIHVWYLHMQAQGARNAALEQQRRLDMEHEELTKREIGALPGETVMGAARRLFQERKTLEGLNAAAGEEIARLKQEVERLDAEVSEERERRERNECALAEERDTLSQRLTETNRRAKENWDKQEAERERLQRELDAGMLLWREHQRQRDAALRRAEQAEERVRQFAIAGQELSAAVDEHVGEGNAASRLAALEELLSPTVFMGYLSAHPPHMRTEANALRWPWESLEKVAALFNEWSKVDKHAGEPCDCAAKSIACIHWAARVRESERPLDMDLMCIACGQCTLHRWQPSPDAGPGWRCSECSALSKAGRYPCSPTCTHDDAALPGHAGVIAEPNFSTASNGSEPTTGHPERVKERSEAFNNAAAGMDFHMGYESGVEAMRAACVAVVREWAQTHGLSVPELASLKAAIEGATP